MSACGVAADWMRADDLRVLTRVRTRFAQLQSALAKKSWVAPVKKKPAPEVFSTTRAGIGGLVRRQAAQQKETASLTTQAFADLEALATNAKKVVRGAPAERSHRASHCAHMPPPYLCACVCLCVPVSACVRLLSLRGLLPNGGPQLQKARTAKPTPLVASCRTRVS